MAADDTKDKEKLDFGAEGSERNTAKRGKYKAICDECGKECYTRFSYTKGRPILCKECSIKKNKETYKE